MKSPAVFASLVLCIAAYSADTLSATDDDYSNYSIQSVIGDMPIRTVVVKISGQNFTSYRGFQFDCASQQSSQTGFYSSPEDALAELSKIKRAGTFYSSLWNTTRVKACELPPGMNVSDSAQPPSAS